MRIKKNVKQDRRILNAIGGVVLTSLLITGCGAGHKSPASDSSLLLEDTISPLPEAVVELVQSIVDGDAAKFASKIDYPLERPYPLKNIVDSAGMVAQFSDIVDDSLKSVVAGSARKDWQEDGWRGWTLKDGQYIWIDENVYDLPYISRAERHRMKKLIERDMQTLPRQYRKGFTPVICLKGSRSGHVYRVDMNDSTAIYRLMVYPASVAPDSEPTEILNGELVTEGTAGSRIYSFTGRDGKIEYVRDASTEEEKPVIVRTVNDHSDSEGVENVYWLDIIDSISKAVPGGIQ